MPTTVQAILDQLAHVRVLVIGDVMLDRYWFGDVERISPEAPVPVAHIQKQKNRLGGAANVAQNLADLGVPVSLLSIVGHDEAADHVIDLVEEAGIDNHLCRVPSVHTTIKLRIIAKQQQLIRLDFEEQPCPDSLSIKYEHFNKLLPRYDVFVLSDYGKGSLRDCQRFIQQAIASGKKVLVDPKGWDYGRYEGAHVITPNRKELATVAGPWKDEDELRRKVQRLRQQHRLMSVLLTRSEEGMTLFTEHDIIHQDTHSQEVYDVSGAGDTVIATLAAAWGAGATLTDAMYLANAAAGCVISKIGTATCSIQELRTLMEREI